MTTRTCRNCAYVERYSTMTGLCSFLKVGRPFWVPEPMGYQVLLDAPREDCAAHRFAKADKSDVIHKEG